MNFHKANIFFLTPVLMIFTLIDLITRGISLSNYGVNETTIAGVVVSFAIIMFSVSSLYEFSKRQKNAFVSTMVVRVVSIVLCCIVSAENFDTYAMYGFDESIAIIFSTLSILLTTMYAFLSYVYYEKRKDILFDKKENNN